MSFKEEFPNAADENDPEVASELRKDALALIKRAFKGEKISYAQLDLSKFVTQAMMAPQNNGGVHIHLTWKEIERARERAGIAPRIIAQLADSTSSNTPGRESTESSERVESQVVLGTELEK